MKLKHVIICRTDGTVEDMILTEKHDLSWYAEQIGCDLIQIVHARGLKKPYLLLCDEEGLLKEKPTINFLGSWLYGTHDHGEPIVGDIIITKEGWEDGECDITGLEAGEADLMADWLVEQFWGAHEAVMRRVKGMLTRE